METAAPAKQKHAVQDADDHIQLPESADITGTTMRNRFFQISRPDPGRLAIVGRPRGGDWLGDEMLTLRADGVDVLVSMLCADEASDLDLLREPEAAAAAGLEFVSLPVPDRGVPDAEAITPALERLHRALQAGQFVAVHCRMGIGRSSLVCAALLRLEGLDADEAWAQVEQARGTKVPDTEEQRRWIEELTTHR